MSLIDKIKGGLNKTRDNISGKINGLLAAFKKIDEDFYEELEETLILCDMGVAASAKILSMLRRNVKEQKITDTAAVKPLLIDIITKMLSFEEDSPKGARAILVVGVNGAGKTTAIGKLAHYYTSLGKSVMLAAADTFRAAAAEQLTRWGERTGCRVIKSGEGADPAAVVYDAADSAKHRNTDVLICDTAGRLHNKKHLMEELAKINRVLEKAYDAKHRRTYLVIDAATGQNAVSQAREFANTTPLSGLILTKVDGTAKGGIVCAICDELKIPVVFLGLGEGMEDLEPFNAQAFAQSLFE
ncbi:MAG: signal recognition particle-docking protein FtsY [Christensenellales bacterium]